jgi:D-galactarolactone cycloisomerase
MTSKRNQPHADTSPASNRAATIKSLTATALEYKAAPGAIYGNSKSMGSFPTRCTVIQIETSDGIVGVGEAGGSPILVREQLRNISRYFIGRSIYDFQIVQAYIYNRLYHSGVQNELTGTLAGIDIALLDAIGKTHGVRVCDLLGGCGRTKFPVYASTGYFSEDTNNRFEDLLGEAAKHSFLGAKIKIGHGVRNDCERVAIAREILGDEILLIADMNAAYTASVALESITALSKFRLHWVEEPLPPWDMRSYAELRMRSPIPLSAGEALYTAREFEMLISQRCVDIVQPSISNAGGLTEAKRIAFLVQLHNLRLAPHVWGSGLGMAIACHFAASLPESPHTDHAPYPTFLEYDIGTENPLRDFMLKKRVAFADSHVELPSGPGLGVEIDWDAVEKYRIF